MLTSLLLIFLIVILLAALAGLAMPLLTRGGPYVVTDEKRFRDALDLAAIKPGGHVIDLGSGDGRFLIAAAQSGATALGYETNPWVVALSRRRIRQAGFSQQAQVVWQSLWQANIKEADVVFIYILPSILGDLEKKLAADLAPGSRVVTIGWPLPTWTPSKTAGSVYLYQKETV